MDGDRGGRRLHAAAGMDGSCRDAHRTPGPALVETARAGAGDGVLARLEPDGDHPGVTYRQAGDRFLLIEYGAMTLDLALRMRIHLLEQWVAAHVPAGIVDVTAGGRAPVVQ